MSTLKPEQLDALLQGYKTPAELESLYSQLLQRMINRGLEAEMDAHLGYCSLSALGKLGHLGNIGHHLQLSELREELQMHMGIEFLQIVY